MKNFTLEVIMYLPAILLMMVSTFLLGKKYFEKKENNYLYLLITWGSFTLYLISGALSFYFLSIIQYQLHFIFIIPITLFMVISVDLLDRYTLDPKKLMILSITITGFFVTLFYLGDIKIIDLPSGGFSIKGEGSNLFWFQLTLLEPLFLYTYYCIRIYIKTPKPHKPKALLNLIGGIIFGPISFILNFIRLGWFVPGVVIIFMSIGAFFSSYAFYRSPELLEVLKTSATNAKFNYLANILPICANCKQIRDSNNEWHPIEDYLSVNSELKFSHGICERCEKELYADLDDEE
ncbi:hypothetical protein [Candidatus Lokiarchaeum ossiferum]|uniref:hypothetical protein n=1 Tax=Candidatus Lokiarchaeum ossiferum TaxID=2951803 RepID=UPI00352C5207